MVGLDPVPLVATTVGRGPVSALAGVVGLLIGSFLNVVVYRVPLHLSVIEPRSFCPGCQTPLRSVDNVPLVSWVVLGRRCRHCRAPISVRYPLVELATGVVFALVGWSLGPHWSVAGFCVVAATLVALVAVEGDGQAPPTSVAVIGTAIATVALLAAGTADRHWSRVAGVAIGVAAAGVLVMAIGRLVPDDAPVPAAQSPWAATPVLLPVGAALGWLGAPYVLEGLAATVVVFVTGHLTQRLRPGVHRGVLVLAFAVGVVVAVATAVARSSATGI